MLYHIKRQASRPASSPASPAGSRPASKQAAREQACFLTYLAVHPTLKAPPISSQDGLLYENGGEGQRTEKLRTSVEWE